MRGNVYLRSQRAGGGEVATGNRKSLTGFMGTGGGVHEPEEPES